MPCIFNLASNCPSCALQSILNSYPHFSLEESLSLGPRQTRNVGSFPFLKKASFFCVGAHKHQKSLDWHFQCLIRSIRMIQVSSKDSLKCRMAEIPLFCFKVDHRPDRLSGSGWSFGNPCFRDLSFGLNHHS